MQTNVNIPITAAQNTAATAGINAANTNLPGLINLSAEEKLHSSKMGPDTYDYCVKGLILMQQNANLTPSWVNQPNIQGNMDSYNTFRAIKLLMDVLAVKLDDSMVQMGIQIKNGVDDFYNNAQAASERGSVAGADAVVIALKDFYHKSQAEQTPPPNP